MIVSHHSKAPKGRLVAWGVQAILLVVLFGYGLDAQELSSTDESRSGVIVRDVTESGRWLLPRTPDGFLTEKPMLYYGLAAALSGPGPQSGAVLRGVSVAMALGTLVLVVVLVRLYGSWQAAGIAAFAFASNQLVLVGGRRATVDMTLTFFICAGLVAFLASREGRLSATSAMFACGAAFGLATLTKGPIGLVLPAAVIGALHLLEPRGRLWRIPRDAPYVIGGGVIALGLALAWYVPGYLHAGMEFLNTSLLSENFYMPLGSPVGLGVGHHKSAHYYIVHQILAVLAVAPIVPLALRSLGGRPGTRPLCVWLGVGFAIFSIASNKRAAYLLPLQPAAAALIGLGVAAWLPRRPSRWLSVGVAGWGSALVLLGALCIALWLDPSILPEDASDIARTVVASGDPGVAIVGLLAVACGIALVRAAPRSTTAIVRATAAIAFLAVGTRTLVYEPILGRMDRTRPFVLAMASHVPQGSRTALVSPPPGYALDFYWPTPLVHRPVEADPCWSLVARSALPADSAHYELMDSWSVPDTRTELVLVRRTGSCSVPHAGPRTREDRAIALGATPESP